MLRVTKVLALAAGMLLGIACDTGRHSAAGFRLPPTGDVKRGQALFLTYECNRCHAVAGVDMPKPTVDPPVPVVLGGLVGIEPTDGKLATSIMNPSYQLAGYPPERVAVAGQSRMPHYAEKMTVQELTDLVAFLQTLYAVRPPKLMGY